MDNLLRFTVVGDGACEMVSEEVDDMGNDCCAV